jgi:virulence-associated protein VapD
MKKIMKQFEEVEKFQQIYRDLFTWLENKGFKKIKSSTHLDYIYSNYKDIMEHDNLMYSFEHEFFDFGFKFLLGTLEHRVWVTSVTKNRINNNSYIGVFLDSDSNEILMEVDVFKDRILNILRDIRKSMISQLEDYNLEY